MTRPCLIIDFDSTFITLESLDELAGIALREHPERAKTLSRLQDITNAGMNGEIGFSESLQRRLELFSAHRGHIHELVELLRRNITPSVLRNADFLRQYSDLIYIISGGFTDYIGPVVSEFGVKPDHIMANRFTFDSHGNITGCDLNCPLAHDNGKVAQVALMGLDGPVWVIGDGYTDYQVKAQGQAAKFVAFTENVHRPKVVDLADRNARSFDEVVAAV